MYNKAALATIVSTRMYKVLLEQTIFMVERLFHPVSARNLDEPLHTSEKTNASSFIIHKMKGVRLPNQLRTKLVAAKDDAIIQGGLESKVQGVNKAERKSH